MHDDLMANRPDGVRHDTDICQFCVADKATEDTTVPDPSRSGGPDVSENHTEVPNEHGGRDTNPMSDNMMSKETHDALLTKAVADAVAATDAALATKTEEAAAEKQRADAAEAELATVKADNARLNTELDTAQVSLTAANEEVTQLKSDIAKRDEDKALAEKASARAEQVKGLGLYEESYVTERASHWATLSDDDWASRLEEWAKVRPTETTAASTTDAASAMSGSTGELTKETGEPGSDAAAETTKPSPRRGVLGLVN